MGLKAENLFQVLSDPSRVGNVDESGFVWNPTGNANVLVMRGTSVKVKPFGQDKNSTSVSFTAMADGTYLRPLIMYPYKKSIPEDILKSIDHEYFDFIGGTGYSRQDIFKYYIENVSMKVHLDF